MDETNQEPEDPLIARIVKVVDGENHCEGGGKPCGLGVQLYEGGLKFHGRGA